MRLLWPALALAILVGPGPAVASTGGHHRHRASSSSSSHGSRHRAHGNRDPEQRARFMRDHPCPSTGRRSGACPGYVVDHVRPLACGGADAPSNMQWQTKAEGKAKDRVERRGCAR